MNLRHLAGVILATALVAGLCTAATAAVIEQPDQNQRIAILAFEPVGQSFTAEDTRVNIAFAYLLQNPFEPDASVEMTLYEGVGTGGTVLQTVGVALPAALVSAPGYPGDFVDANFSNVLLTVGNVYTAAVTTSNSSYRVGITLQETDAYPGGQAIFGQAFSECPGATCDLRFRVTPVPAPAALPLIGAALGALGFLRWKKEVCLASS